jgi:drug/metabolite transporter (DMT)-like permease
MTRAVISATDPATLAMLRYGIGVLCLLPLIRVLRLRFPPSKDFPQVALLGLFFFAGFPWLYNKSLTFTTAAHASIAFSTMPFLTLVVARLRGAEPLTAPKLLGVSVATVGVVAVLLDRMPASAAGAAPPLAWVGDLLMVAGALCAAVYNVFARPYLARSPALSFTAVAMMAGTIGMAPLAALDDPSRMLAFDARTWTLIVALGSVGAALPFYLWSVALEGTTPTRTAITGTLNPVSAVALGTLLLGEPLSPHLLIGLGAITAGIVLTSWRGSFPFLRPQPAAASEPAADDAVATASGAESAVGSSAAGSSPSR